MLAPIDKVLHGGNDTIQIEITRKCDLSCSNCTRLLPFRQDPIEMSLEVFRTAVASVADWPGIVAVFGGNPCMHTKFPEICKILEEFVPPERRGLWTNHTRKHGAVAAATFSKGRLNLNAHGDPEAWRELSRWFPGRVIVESETRPSWHAAILVDYREMGIEDMAWTVIRERCDINRKWSGIIQERNGRAVAYFCEVAGAIDGVTGERNGVEVYNGWWRESMERFAHQVRNCCDRGCAIPLRLKGHLDCDETYDVSPAWLPHLSNPKKPAKFAIHQALPATCRETTDYVRLRT
jgi:hypothetical protein